MGIEPTSPAWKVEGNPSVGVHYVTGCFEIRHYLFHFVRTITLSTIPFVVKTVVKSGAPSGLSTARFLMVNESLMVNVAEGSIKEARGCQPRRAKW